MEMRCRKIRIEFLTLLSLSTFLIAFGVCNALAQTPSPGQPTPSSTSQRPLPDINSLMEQAEAQEKASRETVKEYIFRVIDTVQELDSHGTVKKTSTGELEEFWINGVYFRRLLARDGKPISGNELKKQNELIDKRIADAEQRKQTKAAGAPPPNNQNSEEMIFLQVLESDKFSNPRRVQLNGRDTIAVDSAGNPEVTAWVDEQDHALVRIEAHFPENFKIAGGLLIDVHKGLYFKYEWTKVNDEVWLPASFSLRGSARFALFFNRSGAIDERDTDYRKFRTSSTILPGVAEAPGTPSAPEPTQGQP
jgi:hypothetical protein